MENTSNTLNVLHAGMLMERTRGYVYVYVCLRERTYLKQLEYGSEVGLRIIDHRACSTSGNTVLMHNA